MIGIAQIRASRENHERDFRQMVVRPFTMIFQIPVLLIVIAYFLNATWFIGVNVCVAVWLTGLYGFSTKGLGTSGTIVTDYR